MINAPGIHSGFEEIMRTLLAAISLATVLVAGCSNGGPAHKTPITPSASAASASASSAPLKAVFGFEPIMQYKIDATLSNGDKEHVNLTIGAPVGINDYSKDHKLACAAGSPTDVVVPTDVDVINNWTRPESLDFVYVIAVDHSHFPGGAIELRDLDFNTCRLVAPIVNVAGKVPTGLYLNQEMYLPIDQPAAPGHHAEGRWDYELSGAGQFPTPAVTAIFLRLAPVDTPQRTDSITVTKVTSTASKAVVGQVTDGPDKGVYYVSLSPDVSPCGTFHQQTPMRCGTALP
jgi:hypothetical protein